MSWPQATLGDVTKLIRGITFKPTDKLQPFSEDTVVCMTTRHVQTDLVQDGLFSVLTSFVKREEQYLKTHDVLISNANSYNLVGKVCRVPQLEYKAAPGGFISILRVLDDKVLSPGYFYHWINSDSVQLSLRGCARQTTNIANIDTKRMLKLQIPLPPLSEQKRIAKILDCADAIRRTRQETLKTCDELLRSTFLEMFGDPVTNPMGWEVKSLSSVCKEIYRYPTFYGTSYVEEGTPVARISNINKYGFLDENLSNYVKVPVEFAEKFPRTRLEKHDILMAVRGDGSTASRIGMVLSTKLIGSNMSPNLLRFKVDSQSILSPYLYSLFTSYRGQLLLGRNVRRTAKKTITATVIQAMAIPVPPLATQKKFSQVFFKILSTQDYYRDQLKEQYTLFNSLVQRAFRGEL